jgi:hypothetical protein
MGDLLAYGSLGGCRCVDARAGGEVVGGLRELAPAFVVAGPLGVAIRTRLKGLSLRDTDVLREVGAHLGSLAARDLAVRCRQGLEHSAQAWAVRKRELTAASSSRWAGSVTKATHDQWALARRAQHAHLASLEAGARMLEHRLALPLGAKGSQRAPGGYASRREWHAKARRRQVLEERAGQVRADWRVGRVHVVRGGKQLARTRHHLDEAGLSEQQWRDRWAAARWFLQADGESGKRYGNETIRITEDGQVTLKLPAPLAALANAPHGRYVLDGRARFTHRGGQWADRVAANRAVAYRISCDTLRGRWYVTASWQHPVIPTLPIEAALAEGVIGVDTNADHLAAWRLDVHGNPIGNPRRFAYDLCGTAAHRDAQVRHALTRLLNWAKTCGGRAIAHEDLDFAPDKTREKHGRKRRFRQLISGLPTGQLRARLVSMADATGIAIIAVDPAYTTRWGRQHWQKATTSTTRNTTGHDAASIAIGRRALGHPIRRRTAPPRDDRSDRRGHRTIQARPEASGREGVRPRVPGPRTRSVQLPGHGAYADDQNTQDRSGCSAECETWQQDSLPLSL